MNAKELMIGDWIRYSPKSISLNNYGGLYRAEGVSQDTISLDAKNYRFVVSDKEIDPIPLTPEILEKNEFQLILSSNGKNIYSLLLGTEDCSSIIFLLIDEEKWKLTVKNCDSKKCLDFISFHNTLHVHELQHALRLCGFDDIADNFKV